jgi:hypothetical protein
MSRLAFDEAKASAFAGFCEDKGGYVAHEEMVLARYRHWRGVSGRSYVFSVYAPDACPAYEDAVVLVASRGKALDCVDLGPLPLTTLEGLRRRYAAMDVEFQIHVLADRGADRRALVTDLTPDA